MQHTTHPIATPAMFFYLNSYAFLLLVLGGGAIVISFILPLPAVIIPASVAAFYCIRGGVKILSSWPDKKRKYDILVARNRLGFRPDTFAEFMEAPCGRLLTKKVLNDLGMSEQYKRLKEIRKPLLQRIVAGFKRENKRTVVHILSIEDKKNDNT